MFIIYIHEQKKRLVKSVEGMWLSRLLAGIAGSNSAEGTYVRLLCLLCVV
jgi:hypothetical protein